MTNGDRRDRVSEFQAMTDWPRRRENLEVPCLSGREIVMKSVGTGNSLRKLDPVRHFRTLKLFAFL